MRLALLNEGMDIFATEEEKYQFVIDVASDKIEYESILDWIKKHLTE